MNSLIRVILLVGLAVLSRPAFATPMFEATPGIGFEFAYDDYGETLYQGYISGRISVSGTGDDAFTNRQTYQFTNTSEGDQTFILRWEYWIGGTAEADPYQGEELRYGWDIRIDGLLPTDWEYMLGEFQDRVCALPVVDEYACNNFYDGNEGHESVFFTAGETKTFDLLMDFYASASVAVPEAPSLFVMMAGLLCFVVFSRSRAARDS